MKFLYLVPLLFFACSPAVHDRCPPGSACFQELQESCKFSKTEPISSDCVKSLWAYMAARYGTTIGSKSDPEMLEAANVLDAIGVVNSSDFLSNFATSVGDRIYLPFEIGVPTDKFPLLAQVVICAHEHEHAIQRHKLGEFAYSMAYVTSPRSRALFEADAYRSALEIPFWITGQFPTLDRVKDNLSHYGLPQDDLNVAVQRLEIDAVEIQQGIYLNQSTKDVMYFLDSALH